MANVQNSCITNSLQWLKCLYSQQDVCSFVIFIMYKNIFWEEMYSGVFHPRIKFSKFPLQPRPKKLTMSQCQKTGLRLLNGSRRHVRKCQMSPASRLLSLVQREKAITKRKDTQQVKLARLLTGLLGLLTHLWQLCFCCNAWEPGQKLCYIMPVHVTVT